MTTDFLMWEKEVRSSKNRHSGLKKQTDRVFRKKHSKESNELNGIEAICVVVILTFPLTF